MMRRGEYSKQKCRGIHEEKVTEVEKLDGQRIVVLVQNIIQFLATFYSGSTLHYLNNIWLT